MIVKYKNDTMRLDEVKEAKKKFLSTKKQQYKIN